VPPHIIRKPSCASLFATNPCPWLLVSQLGHKRLTLANIPAVGYAVEIPECGCRIRSRELSMREYVLNATPGHTNDQPIQRSRQP